MDIKSDFIRLMPELTKIRHTIHANPELMFQEYETAKLVDNQLQSYGYQTTTGIGGTGVMAILDSGKEGKTVCLRAEMDALPIEEPNGLQYKSKNHGVMHACGHDGHTTTMLGVANILRNYKDKFKGKIKFIFQPAEEGGTGAVAMIKDGILENPQIDAIFGWHNYPGFPLGSACLKAGSILASNNSVNIKIIGKGGHGAMPELTIDPVYIGTQVVQQLQSIISRSLSPFDNAVLSVTNIDTGTAFNIIPESINIKACLRTMTPQLHNEIKDKIEQIVLHTCQAHSAKSEIEFADFNPPTINTDDEYELVKATAIECLGEEGVIIMPYPCMATEDFSYYLQKVPGCYFFVGNGDTAMCHNPGFVFHDEIMPVAGEIISRVAISYLNSN